MVIRSLWANFGALHGGELELAPGLNLITGDNESGKSTWTAFLEAMLYGIDTSRRAKAGVLPEKTLFAPWQGGRMEGRMELTWQDRELTLVRSTPRANAPMQDLTVRDSRTGEAVPQLETPDCGALLTGVNREVYRRSAFLGRNGLPIGESRDLESRIQSLLTGGDEESSYSEAARRLKDWQNRVARPHTGEISRLEEALERLSSGAGRREALELRGAELQARRQEAADRLRTVRGQLSLLDAREAASLWRECRSLEARLAELTACLGAAPEVPEEKLAALEQALEQVRSAEKDLLDAREDLAAAQGALGETEAQSSAFPFEGRSPEEVWERAQRAAEELRPRPAPRRRWPLAAGVLLVLALAGILPAVRWGPWWLPLLPLAGAAGTAVWGLVHRAVPRRDPAGAALLAQYGCGTGGELLDLAARYRAHCLLLRERRGAAGRAQARAEGLKDKLEMQKSTLTALARELSPAFPEDGDCPALLRELRDRRARRLELERQAERLELQLDKLRAQLGERPEPSEEPAPPEGEELSQAALRTQAAELERELSHCERELAALQGELRTFPAEETLREEREALEKKLSRKHLEAQALAAALDALDGAYAAMQLRFAPELNARAGEYLSRLTGGRYREVLVSRQFAPLATQEGTAVPRQPQELSRGTADQIYLALRLAISRMTLPGNPPLVLDDALVAFDDRRMALALDFFRELAGDQQILLFSCHGREAEYLRDVPDVHHIYLSREDSHE